MATPLTTRSTSDLLYAYMLSSAYRSPWVYSPSGADLKDADIWEIVRNQTDMLAEIQRRNNNIVRPWRIAPSYHASYSTANKKAIDESKKLAAITHEGISHCSNLDEARILLCEDFFVGRKYGVILWEPVACSLDGTPEMLWYLPFKIKDQDRRRVHWVADWAWVKPDGTMVSAGSETQNLDGSVVSQAAHPKGGYLKKTGVHLELFNTDAWRWERITDEQRRNLIECIYYDEEDRLGHGRGVIEAGFFTHYFLTGTYKKIVEGIDRYANGVLIGKLDSLRGASTDKTNAAIVNAMKSVMNTFRSEHYVILGDGDEIELKEPSGTGFSVSMQFTQHLIASWARLCNGSARPAGHSVDGTGAKAQAAEEADTSESFYQVDRSRLDHDLNRDLVGAFLYHNQDNIQALGLEKAKRPKFTSEQIRRQSPEIAMNVINQALAAGMPILRSEGYDRIEFTPPAEGDDVIEPKPIMMGGEGTADFVGAMGGGAERHPAGGPGGGKFAPKGQGTKAPTTKVDEGPAA